MSQMIWKGTACEHKLSGGWHASVGGLTLLSMYGIVRRQVLRDGRGVYLVD
jgi:hypothetical protein